MTNKIVGIVAVAALILSVIGLVGGNDQSVLELGGTRFPSGISADSTSPSAGQVRGTTLTVTGASTLAATTLSGDLTVTTTNTATSTVTAGCWQQYATSTETPIRFSMDLNSTSTAKNQNGTVVGGLVTWGYGSCAI